MKWLVGIIFWCVIATASFSFYQFTKIQTLTADVSDIKEKLKPSTENKEQTTQNRECGEECQKEIEREVVESIAKISISPVIVNQQKSTSTVAPKQVSYAGLGSGNTMSTDWVTLEESAIVLDLENDYSKTATVSWEASLKVAYGNGAAFARLYDATHNIAVDGSELKTESNAAFMQVTSKNLPFWKGRNTYKVQIKSLNGSEVTISGARLKVQ